MSWITRLISKPPKQEANLRPSGKERNERDGMIIASTSDENNATTNDKQFAHFSSHHQQIFFELKKGFANQDGNQKLIDFVVSLNPFYNSWDSNEDFRFLLDTYRAKYYYTSRFYYFSSTKQPKKHEVFSIGKDEDFTRHLASMLSKNVISISQALASESESNLTEDQQKMTHNVTLVLAFLHMLSKLPSNLESLNNSRMLSHVLQILKLVSLKLNSIMVHLLHPHEFLTSVNHEDTFQIWWNHLKPILGYCIQVLANFCGDCYSNEKVPHDFKNALVKLGVPRIFKDIFKLLHDIRDHCESSLDRLSNTEHETVQLELLLMNCTSFLAQENTAAQNSLRDIEMIEIALGNLKWPTPRAEDEPKNENPRLLLEFMIQLVSLHFLSRMIAENTQNYQRVCELGGLERIMDFIFWTYLYFGKPDADLEIDEQ